MASSARPAAAAASAPAAASSSLSGVPHIAYLFSAPLIQRTAQGRVERVEPLDVNKERRQLRQVVAQSNRRVVWSQAVATISNFRNAVTMGACSCPLRGSGAAVGGGAVLPRVPLVSSCSVFTPLASLPVSRATGCRALHFTGHGKPGYVTFEDECACMYLLNAQGLRELFSVGGGAQGVKFVFVSACHSQDVGNAFVAAGVPHVVAVRSSDEVLDDASLLFSDHFYRSLLVSLRAPRERRACLT